MQTTALIVYVRGTNNIAVSALEEVIALRRDLNDEFSTTMVKVAMGVGGGIHPRKVV